MPYVPSRLEEGHGLSVAAVDAAARGRGDRHRHRRLRLDEPRRDRRGARRRDRRHRHRPPPRARRSCRRPFAIVNPHRADCALSGSRASRAAASPSRSPSSCSPTSRRPGALDLADLATIGTVADLAPILGENRAIVRLGLERLRHGAAARASPRCSSVRRVAPADVDLETLAFAVAPRLNAAGRVGEALEAARLLLADDPAEAAIHRRRARDAPTQTRRDLTDGPPSPRPARLVATPTRTDAPATIVRGPWPVGIVGLVAARLAEDRRRPAIVGAELGTSSGPPAGATAPSTSARPSSSARDLFIAPRRPRRRRGLRDRRPSAGRSSSSGSSRSPRARPAGPAGRPRRSILRPRARRRLRASSRTRRPRARAARATRSRSWPSSGSP